MARYRIFLIFLICLTVIISGCNFQGIAQKQNETEASGEIELTGTALAGSVATATSEVAATTPTVELITPSPTPTPIFSNQLPLAVVIVNEEEVLDVRSNPGDQHDVVAALSPHATDITNAGHFQEINGETWVEIRTPENEIGWVKAINLTEQVSSTKFCADTKMTAAVDQFMSAIQARDGKTFARLISPRRGLIIRHEWWNPEVHFQGQDTLENIFNDPASLDWGIQDGSGLPIHGSFKDEILPKIDDVQTAPTQVCNNLELGLASGGSTGFIKWPDEYANFNYMAVYRPAPEEDELNWRTWVIGIEYVNGNPYVVILVQYHWEI